MPHKRSDRMQDVMEQVPHSIKMSRDYLLGIQSPDGYWVGELEADASVAAGYIPFMYYMTGEVDFGKKQKVINYVKNKQREDGSWSTYYDGPGDLSVTVQVYFALKLAGISSEEPFMQRARGFVLDQGGISRANVFTKIWLAVFGQFPWQGTPAMPPEIILLPDWFYVNIYEFASWSRATIVALMVVLTQQPVCPVPETAQLSELYIVNEGIEEKSSGKAGKLLSWKNFFLMMDWLFKKYEKLPFKPGRERVLRRTEKWIVEHQEADGSWGGIMLPWLYSLIALKCLGYTLDHPVIAKGLKGIEDFLVEDDTTLWLQPATSPVWDTAWVTIALRDSGLPADHPALVRAARWLLKEEVRIGGDWQVKNRKTAPGCWSFEFDNDLYPDIDDTAAVPRALLRVIPTTREEAEIKAAAERGLNWVLSMQSSDGGWSAFDVNNNKEILANIPFADFMSPLDPTCSDVTAHVIELMSEVNRDGSSLQRALSYIKAKQEPDGAWYGRWGVNYIYGTGQVLTSLRAAGEDAEQGYIQKAASWLSLHQNEDGGWGETCHTYEDPAYRGTGPSTASQTAWALLGLIAAGKAGGREVEKGIKYLLETQQRDGSWQEDAFTGTGFPRAFYLRYDLYRIYFPLMALTQYQASLKEEQDEGN